MLLWVNNPEGEKQEEQELWNPWTNILWSAQER